MAKHELKQMQSFASPAEKALLNLERTTDHFRRELHVLLREYGLTATQYNALRILNSGDPGGLACSDLASHLVSADPDITRLLDRLAKQKLVRRRRDVRDRRIVLTEITEEGGKLLAVIAPIMDARIRDLFQHLAPQRLEMLIDLLEEARGPAKQNTGEVPEMVPLQRMPTERAC